MDPESKKLLEETFALSKENNEMLHKVRRVQKWGAFWSSFKVIVIVGIALGAFYFLEPYFDKMIGLYNSISGAGQNISGPSFQDLLKKF